MPFETISEMEKSIKKRNLVRSPATSNQSEGLVGFLCASCVPPSGRPPTPLSLELHQQAPRPVIGQRSAMWEAWQKERQCVWGTYSPSSLPARSPLLKVPASFKTQEPKKTLSPSRL